MKMIPLSDIFDVRYGHSLELNRLKRVESDNGIAFVSRKMDDNGVSAFVERNGLEPAKSGELSCALGGHGVLSTFLQERAFYTGRDVAILTAKHELTRAQLLFYALCIRSNRYRYSYGRQANKTLSRLPMPPLSQIPWWVDDAEVRCFADGTEKPRGQPIPLPDTRDWSAFQLQNLFDIGKGKRLTKANMLPGETPFIGATDNNNGVTGFVGQAAIHKGNTITVNYNGGVAEAFYQPEPFWCSDDVNVLYPKFDLTPAIALFLTTVIRREQFRYSYGRKWYLERMKPSIIRLPVSAKGVPDWQLMERYISSLPFSGHL
jgi:hypothetical protein